MSASKKRIRISIPCSEDDLAKLRKVASLYDITVEEYVLYVIDVKIGRKPIWPGKGPKPEIQ